MLTPASTPQDTLCDCYVVRDGKLCFMSGNNIVVIYEHFPDNGPALEALVENVIRYENNHSLPEEN